MRSRCRWTRTCTSHACSDLSISIALSTPSLAPCGCRLFEQQVLWACAARVRAVTRPADKQDAGCGLIALLRGGGGGGGRVGCDAKAPRGAVSPTRYAAANTPIWGVARRVAPIFDMACGPPLGASRSNDRRSPSNANRLHAARGARTLVFS